MKKSLLLISVFGACAASAQFLEYLHPARDKPASAKPAGELKLTADHLSANRQTGEITATGNVTAVSAPYRFFSNRVARSVDGVYTFGTPAEVTTCSNAVDHLHWNLQGDFTYVQDHAVIVKDAWLHYNDIPVAWVPYWYYPLDTDYGLRVMPGYTSRWGCYLLTKYVYNLINEGKPDSVKLGASTYADYRTRNGFGVGQSLRWGLKQFGHGKITGYYAWDQDYDRYMDHNWNGRHRRYRNWGSEVDRERYRIQLDHEADLTERDRLSVHATYLSDSHMNRDFFQKDHRMESIPANEAWYEHRELSWAFGASVSGPVNDFYGGTARLPEAWLAVEPQPIWDLPIDYDSQTRAGYLNRDYAHYDKADEYFQYFPYLGANGTGADYQAFRSDTRHRIAAPFKLWDALAITPRASYRNTYWSDSGDARADYTKASGDGLGRNIGEAGIQASARGTAWLNERWVHTIEPYIDYSYQYVDYTRGRSRRAYVFDNYDASTDWLDQFGFEGRGLPTNWHGVRPGIRNLFREKDESGLMHTVLDWDVYAAVPFGDSDVYGRDSLLAGYPDDQADANYNRKGKHQVVPGTRIRWSPSDDIKLLARAEYDCENSKAAYADITFRQRLTKSFSYHVSYLGRDHRIWDYLPYGVDRWNYEYANIVEIGFEHSVCDWLAWSPYLRYDCRLNEVEEVGSWVDFLQDCIGYRVQVAHETAYERIDGSKERADNRIVFFIYLRAFGPATMLDLAHF